MSTTIPLTDQQISAIQADVRQRYDALALAMDTFLDQLCSDRRLPAQVEGRESTSDARQAALAIYKAWQFEADQEETNITASWYGAIGASPHTLSLARAVNDLKASFKQAMAPVAGRQVRVENPDPQSQTTSITVPLARIILNRIELGHISQRQLTRAIPILDMRPKRLGFTRTLRSPTVERISLEVARNRLSQLDDHAAVDNQLAIVDGLLDENCHLDRNEQEKLAVIHKAASHVRCNVVLPESADTDKHRFQRKWSLPVLYPARAGDDPVSIRWPISEKALQEKNNTSRGPRKIDRHALLPAINAYRYLPDYRHVASKHAN